MKDETVKTIVDSIMAEKVINVDTITRVVDANISIVLKRAHRARNKEFEGKESQKDPVIQSLEEEIDLLKFELKQYKLRIQDFMPLSKYQKFKKSVESNLHIRKMTKRGQVPFPHKKKLRPRI